MTLTIEQEDAMFQPLQPNAAIPNKLAGRDVIVQETLVHDDTYYRGYIVDNVEVAAMHRFADESDEQYDLRCTSVHAAINATVTRLGLLEQ